MIVEVRMSLQYIHLNCSHFLLTILFNISMLDKDTQRLDPVNIKVRLFHHPNKLEAKRPRYILKVCAWHPCSISKDENFNFNFLQIKFSHVLVVLPLKPQRILK